MLLNCINKISTTKTNEKEQKRTMNSVITEWYLSGVQCQHQTQAIVSLSYSKVSEGCFGKSLRRRAVIG